MSNLQIFRSQRIFKIFNNIEYSIEHNFISIQVITIHEQNLKTKKQNKTMIDLIPNKTLLFCFHSSVTMATTKAVRRK